MDTYKVVLVGASGVGKTTLIKEFVTSIRNTRHIPTVGVEVHPTIFNFSGRNVCLNVWDCAGRRNLGGMRDGYYVGANGAIVLFDSNVEQANSPSILAWRREIQRTAPGIPILVASNQTNFGDTLRTIATQM